jgi:hypothetical protein
MTTKQRARDARANLQVTKQRAAAALSEPLKHTMSARQRTLAERARIARELSMRPKAAPTPKEPADTAAQDAPAVESDPAPSKE